MTNTNILSALILVLSAISSFSMNASGGIKPSEDVVAEMNVRGGLVGSYHLERNINLNKSKYSCPAINLELVTEGRESTDPILRLVDKDKCPTTSEKSECSSTISKLRIRNQKTKNNGFDILSLDPDQVIYHANSKEVSEETSDLKSVGNLSVSFQRIVLKKQGKIEELEYRLQGSKGGPDLSCIYKRVIVPAANNTQPLDAATVEAQFQHLH